MNKKRLIFLIISLLFTTSLISANTTPSGWTDDFKAAVTQAQKENKKILINFTGSDWCGWCIKLWDEVFSKKEFKNYAKSNLVSVYVDSPRFATLSKKQQEDNSFLQSMFPVRGFPTIVVLNPDLSLKLITGYQAGGAARYVTHLEKDDILKTLKKQNGMTPEEQIEEYRQELVNNMNAYFNLKLE